ncbi:DNA-3-methyladenine glycosylase isoform X1 [Juglans microcarpa x Juglans regia]|uniref:DNA-3-methyladenine glycosylase isoform X1 n=1 Tax=Juglans microcarpa x Juglans regia TaxID=2249226 RepID=UPI001B7DFE16|nr:DNA-3-methyladenine glycosylase isoform X1 [Juglans microcarpa x Juglans regia]
MSFSSMSKANVRRHVLEKNKVLKEKEKPAQSSLSKNLKRIYPIGLQRSSSSLSLSSLSLSWSQNSNDSSLTDSTTPLDQKISLALRLIAPPERREAPVDKNAQQQSQDTGTGELKRCNWVTKNSDKVYVAFHDECWGVPVYDDSQLFELLAMSGMLMDYNWTEILKRRELFREAFSGFDPNVVAKMGEKEITDIASNKAIMLAESRVRCIVDNAKCILKIVREFGSFSSYMWGYVNHKPVINRYRYPRNIPLRTPKAEALSKDLIKHGFRLVGPVIVCSFMQAAGLTIDHLVDCYRYGECVGLAERPWRHI